MNVERVLIVDDEPEIREVLEEILALSGVSSYLVATGEEALEFLQNPLNIHINLVLCDVNLPEMTGIELYQKMREQKRGIDFIFLSGRVQADFGGQGLDIDSSPIFDKPFDSESLVKVVKEKLAQRISLAA